MSEKEKKKVLLSEPSYGLIHYLAHDNRLDFYMHLARNEEDYKFLTGNAGRYVVHCAREDMATYAVENDCDYLMFIDDDMLVPKDALFRLLEHKVPICAALAFQRVPPFHPVLYRDLLDEKSGKTEFKTITEYPENELFEIGQAGFGMVVIDVQVLRKTPRPWFSSWAPVGEDIFFCFKAAKYGFKTYVDTSVKIQHIADNMIIGEDQFRQFKEKGHLEAYKIA